MEWISVDELMPDFCVEVLVCDDKKDRWVVSRKQLNKNNGYLFDEFWAFKLDNDDCCTCVCPSFGEGEERQVTHWMPLPEVPC